MRVVTADDADLRDEPVWVLGDFTTDDLEHTPYDGQRYEIFDGKMVVSPAPRSPHQRALRAIFRVLDRACPPDLEVYFAPLDFQPTRNRSYQPDVMVTRRADFETETPVRIPPLLAVEVVSRGSRKLDLELKPQAYATSGIDLYWTFDPRRLLFVARRRRGVEYVEVAEATGEQRIRIDEPYPVEICPAEIING
jgi:Uma2 family endonuclease